MKRLIMILLAAVALTACQNTTHEIIVSGGFEISIAFDDALYVLADIADSLPPDMPDSEPLYCTPSGETCLTAGDVRAIADVINSLDE